MRNLDQIIAKLPSDRRAKITARGQKLIAEERALRQLRQARDFTQQNMATLLETDQASISKLEKRSDMLISTMRSYVEAMGGSLRLVAEFPDGCVEVSSLAEVAAAEPSTTSRKARKLGSRPWTREGDAA